MVYAKLCAILARQFEIDKASITPDTNLVDDLGADSLDVVEFTTAIEETFGLIITDEAVREIYTVREICAFVEKLLDR